MHLLLKWIISAGSLFGAAYILAWAGLPGMAIAGFGTALIVALLLGVLHITVRPVLLLLTLPLTILTVGLFVFVVNALMFWFVAGFVEGFEVDGFLGAFFGALVSALITSIGYRLIDRS